MQEEYQRLVANFPRYLQHYKPSAEQMVVELMTHGGLVFDEFVTRQEWDEMVQAIEGINNGGPYILVTRSHVPKEWPQVRNPKCRHITHDAWLGEHITALKRAQKTHKHFNHGDGVTKDFYMPYSTEAHDRERVMRAAESLNLLTNSHYSRPPVSKTRDQLPVYPEQPVMVEFRHRTIEADNTLTTDEQRFAHGTNWYMLRPYMLECQVAVVLDNYCFNDNYSGLHSEKMLYPIAAGIPWIYAGNKHQRELMLQRGFRPHMPMAETAEELINQMLWLKAMFTNKTMTKNWQTLQGEKIIHNQNVLDTLNERLLSESTLCK